MKSRSYIDIRVLKKEGKLFPGFSYQQMWKTEHDDGYTSVDYQVKKDGLVIDYKYDGIKAGPISLPNKVRLAITNPLTPRNSQVFHPA